MCDPLLVKACSERSSPTEPRVVRDKGMVSNAGKVAEMDTGQDRNKSADIQPIRGPERTMAVSDELARLTSILHEICPPDGVISFEYDGALHLHIDVRRVEDVTKIEALLPSLCGGIFHDVQRGLTARHSFFHRISSKVSL